MRSALNLFEIYDEETIRGKTLLDLLRFSCFFFVCSKSYESDKSKQKTFFLSVYEKIVCFGIHTSLHFHLLFCIFNRSCFCCLSFKVSSERWWQSIIYINVREYGWIKWIFDHTHKAIQSWRNSFFFLHQNHYLEIILMVHFN